MSRHAAQTVEAASAPVVWPRPWPEQAASRPEAKAKQAKRRPGIGMALVTLLAAPVVVYCVAHESNSPSTSSPAASLPSDTLTASLRGESEGWFYQHRLHVGALTASQVSADCVDIASDQVSGAAATEAFIANCYGTAVS